MAPRAEATHPGQQPGVLSQSLGLTARLLFWLVMALLFSILIEWLGMAFWWPEEGLRHSQDMLVREVAYLSRDFTRSVVAADPAAFARRYADVAYEFLVQRTGLLDLIQWAQTPPAPDASGLQATLHGLLTPVAEYLIAALVITQVFAVRLAVLTLALPVFLMFALVAVVDGLVQRDLRRWSGGRESSFVYHHAKRAVLPFVILAWVVYLACPVSVHPSLVILPFAVLFAAALAVTVSTFKKYL
jgi:integrating conjugative element membrane protein (TIGR03747 family)